MALITSKRVGSRALHPAIRGATGATVAVALGLGLGACSTPDHSPVIAGASAARPTPIQISATSPSTPQPTTSSAPSASSSGSASTRATSAVNNSTFIIECVDTNLVQSPRSLTLTCGDANSAADSLTWSGWGTERASAVGVLVENTCNPDCANGTLSRYPVQVVASKLKHREATQVYTLLTVTFTGQRPAGQPQVQQYSLPS